jgi:hypothetical protein
VASRTRSRHNPFGKLAKSSAEEPEKDFAGLLGHALGDALGHAPGCGLVRNLCFTKRHAFFDPLLDDACLLQQVQFLPEEQEQQIAGEEAGPDRHGDRQELGTRRFGQAGVQDQRPLLLERLLAGTIFA